MLVDTTWADNLDALISALVAADSVSPYSVAWVGRYSDRSASRSRHCHSW